MGRDALFVRWNGGGGYGDPLDREPAAVAKDIAASLVSREAAEGIYGVAVTPQGALDIAGTYDLRGQMRAARISGSEGAAAPGCTSCGTATEKGWKNKAAVREVPLSKAGAAAFDTGFDGVVLRHFFCPACAALLDTETATPQDAKLHDFLGSTP